MQLAIKCVLKIKYVGRVYSSVFYYESAVEHKIPDVKLLLLLRLLLLPLRRMRNGYFAGWHCLEFCIRAFRCVLNTV